MGSQKEHLFLSAIGVVLRRRFASIVCSVIRFDREVVIAQAASIQNALRELRPDSYQ